jgi:hypothetical protein
MRIRALIALRPGLIRLIVCLPGLLDGGSKS